MWLLSTDRAELHYFARNFDAEGGYAILSHTWDGNEQSFQEVRAIEERCRESKTNPREDPGLSSKIRECCILAEKQGYRWVWVDSCCIDKTSSSELSEAINSMYRWYKASEICYAYLKDVPGGDDLQAPNFAFRKSRWHTRGWTLQELIAPDSVIFLSADWRQIGTRAEFATSLQLITRLPAKLMLGVTKPTQYSACMRMSWAAQRKTTRTEDEAYCLMGLFGVSMPTNYGEGKRAFLRLQYEIMQHQECDMSLFAFGEPIMPDEIIRDGIVFEGNTDLIDRDNPWQYLLADSPRQFLHSFGYIPHLGQNAVQQYPPPDSKTSGPFDRVELPHATVTSYGIQFRLPVATVDGITIAVILCEGGRERHFGLFLTKDGRAKDPQRPRYFLGRGYTRSETGAAMYLARMCDLGGDLYNLNFKGKHLPASWSTIYLVPTASDFDSENATSPNLQINCDVRSRFQLPRWLVERFIGLRFEVDQPHHSDTHQIIRIVHRSESRIFVCLGTCTEHPSSQPPLWAKVFITTLFNPKEFTHDCSQDHLDSEPWAKRSRCFGNEDRTVRLSFTQSKRRLPETAIIIHLELLGRKFKEMLEGSGVSFPSVTDLESDPPCPIPEALLPSFPPRFPVSHAQTLKSGVGSPPHAPDISLGTSLQSQRLLSHLREDFPGLTAQTDLVTSSQPSPYSPRILDTDSPCHTPDTPIHTTSLQLRRLLSHLQEDFSYLASR